MEWLTITNWLKDTYPVLIFIAVLALLIFRKRIWFVLLKFRRKKEQPKVLYQPQMLGVNLYGGLEEQKKVVEDELQRLESEAEQFESEKKNTQAYLQKQDMYLRFKNEQIGMKYNTLQTHLRSLTQMIENEQKLEEFQKVRE